MTKKDKEHGAKHETHIGQIIGPTHFGSGNIDIENLSYTMPDSKNEFVVALQRLTSQLEHSSPDILPEDASEDVVIELKAAEQEATKPAPKRARVLKRLENAKEILLTVGKAAAGVAAISQFVEAIEHLINVANRLL